MKLSRILILGLAVFTLCLPQLLAQDSKSPWVDDYDEALTLAELTGKGMLVNFSGSDWCTWCKKLDKEVFSQEEFLEAIKDKFILVVLDFPNKLENKKKVKNPKRNKELQSQFGVTGFPTVLLMDKTGKPYAKTGYSRGGPAPYIKHMNKLKKTSSDIKRKADEVAALEGESKIKGVLGLFEYLKNLEKKKFDYNQNFAVGFPQIKDIARDSIALDSDNKAGLKLESALFLMKLGDIGKEVAGAIEDLDPNNEAGHLEKILRIKIIEELNAKDGQAVLDLITNFIKDKKFKDKDLEAYINYYGGMASINLLKDKEKAVAYLKKSVEIAENPNLKTQLENVLKQVEKSQ